MNFTIRTKEDLVDAVKKFGILPFFKNSLPGFSVEEHVAPELWFTDIPGPWEWKGPVIRETDCAYGKFFEKKAAYISREWFCHFANWRRDGYDFDARCDDGLVPYRDKYLYDLIEANAPILSKDLKQIGNYQKDGVKGFDTTVTRLQTQGYVLVSDFVYLTDRKGHPYGWGVAEYSTPERFMGAAFAENVYQCEPEESYELIRRRLAALLPEAGDEAIRKFLR